MTPARSAERQAGLLTAAGRQLAGRGLGLSVPPPDLNRVVARTLAIADEAFAALAPGRG